MAWSEIYRPQDIKSCKGETAKKIAALLEKSERPTHILLYGPPGTGKTTIAHCIANAILGIEGKTADFLEVNASADRGIDVIREKIINFARLKPLISTKKVILLDEADSITSTAQQALKRPLEQYEKHTLIIFTANNKEKIIDPIQSRCLKFEVVLTEEDIKEKLNEVAEANSITYTEEEYQKMVRFHGHDLRSLIGALEAKAACGSIEEPDFMPAWDLLQRGKWQEATKLLKPEMLSNMFPYVCRTTTSPEELMKLTKVFSLYDWRLAAFSTNPAIQLQAFACDVVEVLSQT